MLTIAFLSYVAVGLLFCFVLAWAGPTIDAPWLLVALWPVWLVILPFERGRRFISSESLWLNDDYEGA